MNVHKNARLTPKGREAVVRDVVDLGLTQSEASRRHHTTPKTVAKWVKRFREVGVDGLCDRSSCPHLLPNRTSRVGLCHHLQHFRAKKSRSAKIGNNVSIGIDRTWV